MGDILFFLLLLLLLLIGSPIVTTAILFARTRRLRRDVEDLRSRLSWLEHAGARQAALEVSAPAMTTRPVEPVAPAEAPEATPPAVPLPPPPLAPPQVVTPLAPAAPWAAPQPEAPAAAPESLESRIGGRWLLNIGIAAIVIGVAYFEKLAIDNQWIGETARVIQGAVFGAALIYAGSLVVRRGYAFYGQMMAGGGVAILYVSTYAAFNYYHLIDRPPAFALMLAVTALGAFLADRHESQGLAVLAVGGAFMTPFLLPGTSDAQIALFTYVAIVIGGTVFLARRREWPLLHVVSYLFTLITVAAWADRFYTAAKYLPTELYLTLFCGMFIAIAQSCRRRPTPLAEMAAWLLWTAPAAYYLASLVILGDHPMALLIWLIGVALAGGIASVRIGIGAGLALWAAAVLPLLAWTGTGASTAWLRPGLITVAAIYAIALAAQLRQAGATGRFGPLDVAWTHLNALLMFASAYFLLERTNLAAPAPLAAVFAVWQGVLAFFFRETDRDRAVHFTALGCTLLAIAIALQFDGPAVIIGWAGEGAAVIALGLIERRNWMRAGGAVLFGIAVLRTLDLLLLTAPANHVVILNARAACALFVVALCYAIAWLHRRSADSAARTASIASSIVVAQIVSLVLITREIHAYWAIRDGAFTRELMISVTWAIYATVLIVVGLLRRYAVVRYFAIALFGLTIAKVFFSDLAELERIYRVMSVIALGVTLLLTSFLYQRMRGTLLGDGD